MAHLLDLLKERVLLCDGGMGSRVQALDLDVERDYWGMENCTDVLVLSRPDLVREIHRGYFEAGADMVETNTFGASPITLGEFDISDKAFEINQKAGELAREAAERDGLALDTSYHEIFSHCDNQPEAVTILRASLDAEGVTHEPGEALRASEDFGLFGTVSKSAMFYLGAGEKHPALHNPDYDYPDDLIPLGARILMRTARDLLG